MIILEDDLEKLMVSKGPMEVTCESYQELSDRLHHLHPHMQASTGCWEDTIGQVERMLRRANTCPGEEGRNAHAATCSMKKSYSSVEIQKAPIMVWSLEL